MGWRKVRREAYLAKLRDPRWQRRRLAIFERDAWMCQRCSAKDVTLHVHHIWYDGEPWDVPDEALLTLCETCHAEEGPARAEAEQQLLAVLRAKLPLACEIEYLSYALSAADRDALNRSWPTIAWLFRTAAAIDHVEDVALYWHSSGRVFPWVSSSQSDEDDSWADESMTAEGWAIAHADAKPGPWPLVAYMNCRLPNGGWIGGESADRPA